MYLLKAVWLILIKWLYPQTDNKLCDISDDVKEELRKFRFRKSTNSSALLRKMQCHLQWDLLIEKRNYLCNILNNFYVTVKVDREKQMVILDECIDDVSVDELREQLPGHQPRYIVYSYRMEHADGRTSYPICFIFYTPRDSQVILILASSLPRICRFIPI